MFWRFKARLGYALARKLFHWPWCIRQPRLWHWMEGQFARAANLGDTRAQSFYGHILAFRGQGLGAREEGVRLLRLAALSGDGKAAYQVGVFSLAGTPSKPLGNKKGGPHYAARPFLSPLNYFLATWELSLR